MINHLLIIDDEEINNFLMGELLSEFKEVKKFKFFINGWDALDYLRESQKEGNFPDLILVDLNMPQMDGYEFTEYFENEFYPLFPETQLVILSNSIRLADKERSLEYSSVKRYLNKPLDEKKLREVIHSSLRESNRSNS